MAPTCRRLFNLSLLPVIFFFLVVLPPPSSSSFPHPCFVIYGTFTVQVVSSLQLRPDQCVVKSKLAAFNLTPIMRLNYYALLLAVRKSPLLLRPPPQQGQRSGSVRKHHPGAGRDSDSLLTRFATLLLRGLKRQPLIAIIFTHWWTAVSHENVDDSVDFSISTSAVHLSNTVMVPSLSWAVTC